MSQNSIRSATSAFVPINSDNGERSTPVLTSKLDKSLDSVTSLQNNATELCCMLPTIDGIVDCIESASFKGKRDVCSKLKSIRTAIDAIQAKIQADSIVLSPIPSMAYANNRNQVQLRRSVSPETVVPTPKSSNSKRKVQHTIVSKSKKRPNTKTSDAVLQYPTPSNGVLYTPKEFVDIIASKPKKVRRPIMLQMIQNKTVSVQEMCLTHI